MSKKSFLLYLDQKNIFEKLPDEIAGKLIKHIFAYVDGQDIELKDLLLDIAFEPIKQSLNRDLSKWEEIKKKKSEAGKKSAEARANNKKQQKETKSTPVKYVEQNSTNPTVNVSVSDSVSVSDTDKEEHCQPTGMTAPVSELPDKQIFDYWVTTLNKRPSSTKFTDKRKKVIRARLKEGYTVGQIKQAIVNCAKSSWHMGANDRNQVYDDIELICRDGPKLESFINRLPDRQASKEQQDMDSYFAQLDSMITYEDYDQCKQN